MAVKHYKNIQAVGEDGTTIAMQMTDAINQGLRRRGVQIFIFNESGQILLQKRGAQVMQPNLLEQSAGGHVDEGETYYQAAVRELEEELNLSGYSLEEITTEFKTDDFVNGVYKLVVTDDISITVDPEEVTGATWYDLDTLAKELKLNLEKFNPDFVETWSALHDKLTT